MRLAFNLGFIAVTFCNHEGLLRSLRLPYSAPQLLNYQVSIPLGQRVAYFATLVNVTPA